METPTIEGLAKKWNEFSTGFTEYNTHSTTNSAFILVSAMKFDSPNVKDILEVGGGAGMGTELILKYKPSESKVITTDLAPDFLSISKNRLSNHPSINTLQHLVANAEQLSFSNSTFDRYFANFVIHLVPNPLSQLQEAYRVLRPNGIAGFSVWGRTEFSLQMTIISRCINKAKETSAEQEQGNNKSAGMRSPFHLASGEELLKMAKEVGFKQVYKWYAFNAFTEIMHCEIEEAVDLIFKASPGRDDLKKLTTEEMEKAREEARKIVRV